MSANFAVYVQNAFKSYGKKEVLKNLCMQVPKGNIYGLLGSSGCGKTTILSCIVGRRVLDSGDIWVLGGQPGMEGSGIPGPKVGYMPQDIALVGEFTVQDAVYYFGRIMDMPESKIEERLVELSTLLDLPPRSRFIRNCSGGQQRRVSFAASMVHLPELLILDEPTVGVDPILRERIWDYLVEITTRTNTAVIITTHYIEEARQANLIGLMRDGCLLAEESPIKLLNRFQAAVLEDVFFILSQRQAEGKVSPDREQIQNSNTDISLTSLDTTRGSTDILTDERKTKKRVGGYQLNGRRLTALLDKNWKQFYRNVSGVIFVLLFPIMQCLAFLLAVGPDIKDIKLAVVNDETISTLCPHFLATNTAIPYDSVNCHLTNMSCRFLNYLEDPMIKKIKYDSLPEALDGIRHGNVVGAIYMANNFTESFEERIEEGRFVDPEILDFSQIQVWLDMSDRQVGYTMKYKLISLFRDFQKDLLDDCNYNSKFADVFKQTMFYGTENDPFTYYIVPGLVLTIMFFMMTMMTSQIIVADRCEGLWDRSIIAGVSSLEITITHLILQSGIVLIYTAQVLIIPFAVFKTKVDGSLWTLAVLTFLQGQAGVGFGFWISIVSYNVTMAHVITSGSFYIMILLCGLMWPLEGMPLVLQWISKSLPFTIPISSFRNVMRRGWSLTNLDILTGIGVEFIWIIIFTVMNIILIRFKR